MKVNYVGISASTSSSPEHEHESFELILNLKGSGCMTIENTDYQFTSGTVVLCPPKNRHIKQAESSFKDIYLRFDDDLKLDNVITYNDSENKTIKALLYQALRYYNLKNSGYQEILNKITNLILTIISFEQSTKKSSPIVESLKNIIIENFYDTDFNFDKIYAKMSYNPDYIRRCFKKEMKITPSAYLTSIRINNAVKLMDQNLGMNISDIAFACGFNDSLYFSKVFKQYKGVSPREYLINQIGD